MALLFRNQFISYFIISRSSAERLGWLSWLFQLLMALGRERHLGIIDFIGLRGYFWSGNLLRLSQVLPNHFGIADNRLDPTQSARWSRLISAATGPGTRIPRLIYSSRPSHGSR